MTRVSRSVAHKRAQGKKKVRRQPPQRAVPGPLRPEGDGRVSAEVVSPTAVDTTMPKRPELPARNAQPRSRPTIAGDYGYVFRDLRRIAVVAGALLIALAALTFVVH